MCGICGIVDIEGRGKISKSSIVEMCHTMTHRGPDGEGFYVEGNIGLGMRRLSVIDLHQGWQPIYNEAKDILVFQNGEIYNYLDLKKELIQKGHRFETNSDTEVIVHLYEELGDECLKHLNGMFSVAILDLKKKRLLVARDRVGIKPLFYSLSNSHFVFGSELKTVMASGLVSSDLNHAAINDYFTFLYVVPPRTIYKEASELQPGHMLIYEDGKVEEKKYWQLSYIRSERLSEAEYSAQFLDLFRKAIKRQMISDVPLGAFLSGGIDSSAIVAMMSEVSTLPIKTFTIGYGKKESYYDEREYANKIAKQFGTEHYEFQLDSKVLGNMESIVDAFDQPFGNSSVLPNYFISQQTRKHVTVALSGLGGDELFCGYERYVGIKLGRIYKKIPAFLRARLIEKVVSSLPDSKKGSNFAQRLKRFVSYGKAPVNNMYYNLTSCYSDEMRERIYSNEFNSEINIFEPCNEFQELISEAGNYNDIEKALYVDFHRYLPNDLLTLTDRMSMAHSLETRVPFLDFDLIDFVNKLPLSYKLNGYKKKYLLKKAFSGILPDSILYRKKMGFSVPLVLWFRNELRHYIHEVFDRKKIEQTGFFSWKQINMMLNLHLSGKENYFSQIWALFVFLLWYEKKS